jgi:hypothetical protein
VGDGCWSLHFDEDADFYVPGLIGYVVGVERVGFNVGCYGPHLDGTLVIRLRFNERVFRSRSGGAAAGVVFRSRPGRRYVVRWLP